MRKYFTSGLVILLPIVFTITMVQFIINFLTHPFLKFTKNLLKTDLFYFSSILMDENFVTFFSQILILIFLFLIVIFIGIIGKLFLIDSLLGVGEYFLHKVPFINKIYKTCQDIVHSVFSSSSKKFTQVVFAPFPNTQNLCVGLVTGESIQLKNGLSKEREWVSVFIPGTPNPSVGFLLMFERHQLHFVDMKVEEAMKFIVSCGILMPDFATVQPSGFYDKQPLTSGDFLSRQGQCS